jgi:hypothetical protein
MLRTIPSLHIVIDKVGDVGQDFHLVPKMSLLPKGSDLTSELWPNRLIHGQLYRWHLMDTRTTIIRHWKYKRKWLPAKSKQSRKLRQDNFLRRLKDPKAKIIRYSEAETDIIFRGRDC